MPHIESGVGALATQALINPFYGPRGLRLLREGKSRGDVVQSLTAADAGREHRQLHVMDAAGRIAAHTGKACIHWCGSTAGEDFSVAGNMLAGPRVLAETAQRLRGDADAAVPAPPDRRAESRRSRRRRQARQAVRGAVIYGDEEYPDLDLRVDDHADPLAELERLEAVSRERFVHFAKFLPSQPRSRRRHRPRRQSKRGIAAALAPRRSA